MKKNLLLFLVLLPFLAKAQGNIKDIVKISFQNLGPGREDSIYRTEDFVKPLLISIATKDTAEAAAVAKYKVYIKGNQDPIKSEVKVEGNIVSFIVNELVPKDGKAILELRDVDDDKTQKSIITIKPKPTVAQTKNPYLTAINTFLTKTPGYQTNPITENKLYQRGDTVYIFLDSLLNKVQGTVTPNCNSRNTYYRFFYLRSNKSQNKAFYEVEENETGSDLVIAGVEAFSKDVEEEEKIVAIPSEEVFGPYSLGVDIKITLRNEKGDLLLSKEYAITACSIPYQVSIMGGFYVSSLNNPTDIVQDGNGVLNANNATSQRALTLMAVFYPNERDRYYRYRDLSFWDKWSVCFGTKISQNLFDDLLLGLNYEFAKGGSFAGGVHYGQHAVIPGYKNFKFGSDIYNGTFNNSVTRQQWDFGFFVGVNIDLRIIGAIRDNTRDQNRQNQNHNQTPAQNPQP